MKVRNKGPDRWVPGVGLVPHGAEVDVSETTARALLRAGFVEVKSAENKAQEPKRRRKSRRK